MAKTFSFQDTNVQRKEFEDFEKKIEERLKAGLNKIISKIKKKKKEKKEIKKNTIDSNDDYYTNKENTYQEKLNTFIKEQKKKEDGKWYISKKIFYLGDIELSNVLFSHQKFDPIKEKNLPEKFHSMERRFEDHENFKIKLLSNTKPKTYSSQEIVHEKKSVPTYKQDVNHPR